MMHSPAAHPSVASYSAFAVSAVGAEPSRPVSTACASSAVKARSCGASSETSPRARSTGRGLPGTCRVDRMTRKPRGSLLRKSARLPTASASVMASSPSRISVSGSSVSRPVTRLGRISSSHASSVHSSLCRRADNVGRTWCSARRMPAQSRPGALSWASRLSQAHSPRAARPCDHSARRTVFPAPAGPETTTTGSVAASSRRSRRGRVRRCGGWAGGRSLNVGTALVMAPSVGSLGRAGDPGS